MRHELLEEVWRVREEIANECGHDLKKLAATLRQEEAKYGDRLVRLPIARQAKGRPANALREEPPEYGKKSR